MRKILLVLVIIFSFHSLIKADEVKEFEIEGVSVGESLLQYLKKNEIEARINHENSAIYPNSDYISINYKYKNLNLYDALGVVIKKNDKDFIIYSVEGTLYYKNNKIEECYKKQNQIRNDLKIFFGNKTTIDTYESIYNADETGNSKVRYIDFDFKDTSNIRLICFDLSDEINKNDPDQLYVVANSKEFMDFLNANM